MATLSVKELIDIVGFVDPASGKTSTPGCENAIVIVGQDEEGRAYVLDEYGARESSDTLNLRVFQMNSVWHCKRFGIEASAQQYLYYEAILREANIRHERIALVPIEQPTNQVKEWRITTTIQEWMHNGMLYVDRRCVQLKKQLEVYPTGQLVDIVDALASALRMLRNPFTTKQSLAYDERYDDYQRWHKSARRDPRYAGFRGR